MMSLMNQFLKIKVRALFAEQEGQGMVEYALIIGLVAVGVIAVLGIMSGTVGDLFTAVTDALKKVPGVVKPTP